MSEKYRIIAIVAIFVLLPVIGLFAQDAGEQEKKPMNAGLIFNLNESLFGFESYQGGLGLKLGRNNVDVRLLVDLFYSNSINSFSGDFGLGLEYHLKKASISPYLGFSAGLGYSSQKEEVDEDYTLIKNVAVYGTPLFGVEIFLLDFLSVFVEYGMKFEHNKTTTEQKTADETTSEEIKSLVIDSGLGNNAKIGIVVYFSRVDRGNALINPKN